MNEKMRLSVEDDSDSALISKKFWTHVKSKSKSTRIPETVRYGDRFRNTPVEQASLFNELVLFRTVEHQFPSGEK